MTAPHHPIAGACPICADPVRTLVRVPGFAVPVCRRCADVFTTPAQPRDEPECSLCGQPTTPDDRVITTISGDPIGHLAHRGCASARARQDADRRAS